MDSLKTNHPLALSFLFNEDLYVLKDDVSINETSLENSTTAEVPGLEKPEPVTIPKLQTVEKPVFEYIGDNNKYILIIVKDPLQQFLNAKELEFLLKILSAKKLGLQDIAIINTETYEALNFNDLKEYFALSKILTFGINPVSLNISGITANKTGEYNGVKILGTWTLAQLESDVKKKTIYWNELKNF